MSASRRLEFLAYVDHFRERDIQPPAMFTSIREPIILSSLPERERGWRAARTIAPSLPVPQAPRHGVG